MSGAAASAFLLAIGGAFAAPPTITETFDSGNDGWEIYEGDSESPAAWISSGGNPGGFIRYEDADSASSDAVFADEDYVTDISDREGQVIVADLRTGSAVSEGPTVYLGDPYDLDGPMIHLRRDPALSTGWTHYEFPVKTSNSHRWRDDDGEPLTDSAFADFLATNPAIFVRADYSAVAGETTDFDNVGIVMFIPRTVTLRYSGSQNKFTGRLKSDEPQCKPNIDVTVFRVKNGKRDQIGKATTNSKGKYALSDPGKPGKYFSRVKETELGSPLDVCAPGKSKKVKLD